MRMTAAAFACGLVACSNGKTSPPATDSVSQDAQAMLEEGGQTFRHETVGVSCALCHSTVDDPFAPGSGHRRDGFANRDLNVGAIVNLSPDLSSVATLLGVAESAVRTVLQSWGPGKFDAELFLDRKTAN